MTHDLFLFLTTFLASGVEAVEALTIVLALGVVRGWRSPLIGVGVAALVLIVIVAVLGPALSLIPIDTLRLVVGSPSGLRSPVAAQGDSSLQRLQGAARRGCGVRCRARAGIQRAAFRAGCDGLVLVHGRFQGSAARRARGVSSWSRSGRRRAGLPGCGGRGHRGRTCRPCGDCGALAAERVPENTIKFTVGLLLTSFGVFWAGRGRA